MHTTRKSVDDLTQFIIVDAPPKYHEIITGLAYAESSEGFEKAFPSNTTHLDSAYNNFQQYIETVIRQAAKEVPVLWDDAFEAFLARTYHIDSDWWVAGSLALALRGLAVTPGDLDFIVDSEGALKWGDALVDAVIEPVSPTGGWFCEYWGRAFLGARIEWTGGVDPNNQFSYVQDFYLPSVGNLETINWRGYEVRIPPLEPQLKIEEARGRTERAALIRAALGR